MFDNGENKENIPPTSSLMIKNKKLTLKLPSAERLKEIAFDAKTVPMTPTVEKKNSFAFMNMESFYGTPHNGVNVDEIKQDLGKAPKRPQKKLSCKRRLTFTEVVNSSKTLPPSSLPLPPLPTPTPSPPQGLSDEECMEFFMAMIDDIKAPMKDRLMAITFTAILEAVKTNSNGAVDQLIEVRDNASFVKTVYNLSTTDKNFWIQMKSLTLGSTNGIIMATTPHYAIREELCPAQFSSTRPHWRNFIPSLNQKIGQFGEDWVEHQLDMDRLRWLKPGKICDFTFPIMSATPDYILMSDDHELRGAEGMPIDFPFLIGFEECKSSYIWPLHTTPKWSDDLYTVEDILFDRRCKPSSISASMLRNDAKPSRKPIWPNLTNHLYDTIMASMKKTIKWRSVYMDEDSERCVRLFNPEAKGNQLGIKLFTSNLGKQLLMEGMMIVDYIQGDHILVRLDMPSVMNKNELLQNQQYEDRAERRRFNTVLPGSADAALNRTNFMYNPEIAEALHLNTPSDDEDAIEDQLEVKYSLVAEFYLPVASVKELRDVVIRPAMIEAVADVAEKNFFIQKPDVNLFDRKPRRAINPRN
ncbi:hypothetical protein RRG08_061495 [Elysia crispata]|uniref:Uncharacterized protein n=2 Tax=Elysia crispata TaxID=231223 RepID=A0AAE1CLB9_9GAST|nr:hypothetical protein RRG08_061495 [Elysia crispata]